MRLLSARLAFAFLAVLSVSGCEFLTGGGGGGGGTINFQRGFVYVRKDDRNLYIADEKSYVDVQQLTTGGGVRQPSLSADGKVVVFIATQGTDTVVATVPARGGTLAAVFRSTATVKNLRTPVFSPDGTKIVFAYDEGASSVIGVVNADGSGFAKVAGGTFSYASPSFLPGGTALLVAAGNPGSGYTQVERIELATGTASNISSNLGNDALQIQNRLVASPDGASAAFDGRISSGASRIFVMNLTTRVVTQVTDYPSEPGVVDAYPSWVASANVAFNSDTGGADQVYVLASDSVKTSGGLTLPRAIEAWYGPN